MATKFLPVIRRSNMAHLMGQHATQPFPVHLRTNTSLLPLWDWLDPLRQFHIGPPFFALKTRRTQFISSLIESWGLFAEQTQAQSGSEPYKN